MKVLVTGTNGFIGQHWIEQLSGLGIDIIATGLGSSKLSSSVSFRYRSLDITDSHAVQDLFKLEKPNAILHAAAISKPDQCELDRDLAERVNVIGTRNLLEASVGLGAYFCLISTDFVFDGVVGMYTESDQPAPINFYGHTKWRAEQLVQQYPNRWSIARTVSVYGPPVPGRANLLSTVIDKLRSGEQYSVVDDQIRTPTYAGDLAGGVARLIRDQLEGIFHLSGQEVMTPFDMAFRTAQYLGLDTSGILRVNASTFRQPATRPQRTGFNIAKAKHQLGFKPRSFEEGLRSSFRNG